MAILKDSQTTLISEGRRLGSLQPSLKLPPNAKKTKSEEDQGRQSNTQDADQGKTRIDQ